MSNPRLLGRAMRRRTATNCWVLNIDPFTIVLSQPKESQGSTVRLYAGGEQPLQIFFAATREGVIGLTEQYLERLARDLTLFSPCTECAERFAQELSDLNRR